MTIWIFNCYAKLLTKWIYIRTYFRPTTHVLSAHCVLFPVLVHYQRHYYVICFSSNPCQVNITTAMLQMRKQRPRKILGTETHQQETTLWLQLRLAPLSMHNPPGLACLLSWEPHRHLERSCRGVGKSLLASSRRPSRVSVYSSTEAPNWSMQRTKLDGTGIFLSVRNLASSASLVDNQPQWGLTLLCLIESVQ